MSADVYQCFADDGTLLYVGSSMSGRSRLAQHRQGSDWWPQVAVIRVEHLTSRPAAEMREADLIRESAPIHNVRLQAKPPVQMVVIRDAELPIGRALKVERVAAGVSSTRIAQAVGISIGHLSHIEAGRRVASPDLIERIRTAIRAAA